MESVSTSLLQSIMDVSAKAMAVVSASGHIRYVNGALLRTFGFTAGELVGQPIQTLIPTGLKSDDLRVGGPHPAVVCGKNGTHTTVQLHVVNSDGDDILLTLLESEEEDRRLHTISQTAIHEQIRGDFLARMSHELRTPLNAVLGTVSGMLDPPSGDVSERRGSVLSPAQTTGLETIRTAGESLLSLIVDILDFSTVHSENGPAVQFVDFNLLEVVTEALRIAAASMHFSYPGVVLFVDPALPLIARSDPVVLSHVLVKIVTCLFRYCSDDTLVLRIEHARESECSHVRMAAVPAPDCPTMCIAFHLQDGGLFEDEESSLSPLTGPVSRLSVRGSSTQPSEIGRARLIVQRSLQSLGGFYMHNSSLSPLTTGADGSSKGSHVGSEISIVLPIGAPHGEPPLTWTELAEPACGTHIVLFDINPVKREALAEQLRAWKLQVSCVLDVHSLKSVVKEKDPKPCIALHVLGRISSDAEFDAKTVVEKLAEAAEHVDAIVWSLSDDSVDVELGGRTRATAQHKLQHPSNPAELLAIILKIVRARQEADMLLKQQPLASASVQTNVCLGHVLIADDNSINLRVAKSLLEHRGYKVDTVNNGKEAVDILLDVPYDIVLMDVEMPVMDGLQATQTIRARELATDHTPIIAVTAHALESDRTRCLESGMDDFISKPLIPSVLMAVLSRWSSPIHPICAQQVLQNPTEVDRISMFRNLVAVLTTFGSADRSNLDTADFRSAVLALESAAHLMGARRLRNRCRWFISALEANDFDLQAHVLADLDYEAALLKCFPDF